MRSASAFSAITIAFLGLGLLSRADAQGSAEDLRLTVGKSVVIDYPVDIGRISTSNPDVVDASPVTTREILLHGKSSGTVTLIVWSKTGQRTFYNINVEQNLDPLRRLLRETFPGADFQLQCSRDSLSITGKVPSKDVAERAMALAAPFAKTIVSNVQIEAPPVEKQILLRVKFAVLDRNNSSDFAVNFISTGAGNTVGRITTGQDSPPTPSTVGSGATSFSLSDALNIFAFRPDLNLGAFIRALQQRGILQILAEPNLVTTNGKEASFLSGGEFPVPVIQGGANSGAITIQFREYGIRLTFTPVITPSNTIQLHVKPEVSSLDAANGVSVDGFVIPALSTRKIETNIELQQGQSFVIAGLIDDEVTENLSRMPGLASLPILGPLFKSRTVTKSRTELVVLVTPEITSPLEKGQPAPLPMMPREFMGPLTPRGADPKEGLPASAAVRSDSAADDAGSHK